MISKEKAANEFSASLCPSLKAVHNWTTKLSLQTAGQSDGQKFIKTPGRMANVTDFPNIIIS
ncbi:hypothetical protein MXB_5528 [Myxobolus squamalis]|nr:hypothetical protein MXB_5528 [Myxobolus squamalis]